MKTFLKDTALEAFQRIIFGFGFGAGMSASFAIASKYDIEKPEYPPKQKLNQPKHSSQ